MELSKMVLVLIGASIPLTGFAQTNREEMLKEWQTLSQDGREEAIIRELDRCPCWIGFNEDETEIRSGILRICENLEVFDTPTLKAAISRFWQTECDYKSNDYQINRAKIYLLNRVLFEVPQRVPTESLPFDEGIALGGYYRVVTPGWVDIGWPFGVDRYGALVFIGWANAFSAGSHSGYSGLKDFDYLQKNFKRRAPHVGLSRD